MSGLVWASGPVVAEDVIAMLCDADRAARGEPDLVALARSHAYIAEGAS